MRLKIKFEYECQLEIDANEAKNFRGSVTPEFFTVELAEKVNEFFLQNDGRTEVGIITDFEYEVEE